MGTGIVFVVLVAIWVVYFVQYWSRRREHLATARSVESFAEAMRVLERRPALRTSSGARVSSAYAMSPTRVVSARPAPRPQVIAKPHAPSPSRRPSPPQRGGAPEMSRPSELPKVAPRRRPTVPRPRMQSGGMSPSRKVRGLTLLASMAATLVTAGLTAFTTLLWWVPLIAVAAVAASFLWLRSGVQAEIAARKARRRRVGRPAQRTAAAPSGRAGADADALAGGEIADWTAEPGSVEPATASDVDEAEQGPDGWQPVPVPPPTYTLKAKAERPLAADAATPAAATPIPDAPAPQAPGEPTIASGGVENEQRAAYGT